MGTAIKLKFPGFYVKVINNTYVSNPKGWKFTDPKRRVALSNTINMPRENDIAEVLDIDTYTDGTRCYLCRDIDGFMFCADDPSVELYGKNWPETAERIKKEFAIK